MVVGCWLFVVGCSLLCFVWCLLVVVLLFDVCWLLFVGCCLVLVVLVVAFVTRI